MKIVAERGAILDALAYVATYADSGRHIPIIGHVRVVAGVDVTLHTTDMEREASCSFDAQVDKIGDICLPAHLLLKAIKSASGSEAKISCGDVQATVSVGTSTFRLPIMPGDEFPSIGASDPVCEFTLDGSALHDATDQVSFAAEKPGGRHYLAGVSWRVRGGNLEFCATDGKRLSLIAVGSGNPDMPSVIVPIFPMPEWTGEVSVSLSDRFVRLDNGRKSLASKLIDGTYPDYPQVIPNNNIRLTFDRESLMAAVNRMGLVSDKQSNSILFIGRDGTTEISTITQGGEVHDTLSYDGGDFQFAALHSNIAPVLASFDCENIELRWADHLTGVTIHEPDRDDRIIVVQPFRDDRLTQHVAPIMEAAE